MSGLATQGIAALRQTIDYCSSSYAVYSTLCPYEALKKDAEKR